MLSADTDGMTVGAGGLEQAGAAAEDAAQAVHDAGRRVAASVDGGPVGAAVARFVAATGGELLGWGLDSAMLSMVAVENADQMSVATGGR